MTLPAKNAATGVVPVSVRPVRGHDGTSVIITLAEGLSFERLRVELVRVLSQTPERWRNGVARLDLGDRAIELLDVRRLIHLLRDDFSLSVTALYLSEQAVHRYVARELKLQLFVRDPSLDWTEAELSAVGDEGVAEPTGNEDSDSADGKDSTCTDDPDGARQTSVTELASVAVKSDEDTQPMAAPPGESAAVLEDRVLEDRVLEDRVLEDRVHEDKVELVEPVTLDRTLDNAEPAPRLPVEPAPISFSGGRRALTVARTLRGGQRVQFPGDIIVFGDVNPGAAVEAGGHILVMGSMRGLAHAGLHGASDSVILAFDLRPTQLRIGPHIAFAGGTGSTDGALRLPRGVLRPEVACVKDGQIIIEEYTGRLPVPLLSPSPPHGAANTAGSEVSGLAHTE